MKYYLKQEKKITISNDKTKKDVYYEALKKTKLSFYFSLLNNKPMSKIELLSKWYQLVNIKREYANNVESILFSTKYTKINEKGNIGFFIKTLSNFYDNLSKEKFAIVLVNTTLPVIIDNRYEIKVPIDLIKEIRVPGRKRPALEIIHEVSDKDKLTEFSLENDMYISLVSHAFRKTFGYTETHIKVEQPRLTKTKYTQRNNQQIKEALDNIEVIASNIEKRNFYKIIGHKCNECPYKEECSRTKII